MTEHKQTFAVTVRDSLAGLVLECSGELDLDQATTLHVALHRAFAGRPTSPMLLVDLGAVTFMDSSGLNALLLARTEAARQGARRAPPFAPGCPRPAAPGLG